MIFPMNTWAGGSDLLWFNTNYTLLINVFSALMLVGSPGIMMADYNFRLGLFIFSTITVFAWLANFIFMVAGFARGGTPTDSVAEMIEAYWLVINFS